LNFKIVRRARVKPCAAQSAIGGAPPSPPLRARGEAAWDARPVKFSNSGAENQMPKSKTVFVVDDSASLRQRLVEMLSAVDGLEVVGEAQNACEAVSAIHSLRPEVVILDIQMPDGTGLGVLREVKRDYPGTVVIMLTDHAEAQYQKRCLELKADYFLSKSADWKLLIEIGEQLAGTRDTVPMAMIKCT
jgi:CheY-like chemotaxis protein